MTIKILCHVKDPDKINKIKVTLYKFMKKNQDILHSFVSHINRNCFLDLLFNSL